MRSVIVDASVIGSVLLKQGPADALARLADLLATLRPVQPAHWPLEVAGLALRGAREQSLSASVRDNMRDQLGLLLSSAEIDPVLPAVAVFDVVQRHRLGVYDAPYLELAIRRGLPLLTRDGGLKDAAARAQVELIELP